MQRSGKAKQPLESQLSSAVSSAVQSSAEPLEPSTRALMESRFNHSFKDVLVHSETEATNALDARAFAYDNHLAFSKGQYAPGTPHGDALIAHELAHVVQNRGGGAANGVELAAPDAASEREAHRAADAVTRGAPVPSLSASSPGLVSRSLWDWIPGMGGFSGTPAVEVPGAPGDGVQAGPYYYGNIAPAGGGGGVNFGYGRGHAQGSADTSNLIVPGDSARASGTYDNERLEGHIGGWNVARQDGGNDVNVGFQMNGKTPSASGELSYTGPDGSSTYLQGDANGPAFDVSSYAGTGGFNFGAQAAVGGFNVASGTRGTDTDEYNKIGLSEGVGAAVRGNWGDTDGDGFREYGGGFDVGPVSVDMRTEDPLRAAVRMGANGIIPGMGFLAEQFIDDGNFTERTANRAGLTTRNADLGTTWDVVTDAASSAGEYAVNGLESAGTGLVNAGGAVVDGASSLASEAYNALPDWPW